MTNKDRAKTNYNSKQREYITLSECVSYTKASRVHESMLHAYQSISVVLVGEEPASAFGIICLGPVKANPLLESMVQCNLRLAWDRNRRHAGKG
jgi:hypothetical protein